MIFEGELHIVRRGRSLDVQGQPARPKAPPTRPLRVARLIALAHRLRCLVDAGESPSQLALRLGFSRARVSQILDLSLLCPSLQERLVFMTNNHGHDWITERALRAVVRHLDWADQRTTFDRLFPDII